MNTQDDKDAFDETANNKETWRMRAEDLHTSAALLRGKFVELSDNFDPEKNLLGSLEALKYAGSIYVSAMLQGFAIEVYLKAYYLHTGNKLSEDGEYGIDELKNDNHKLHLIADAVSYQITPEERDVLERLSLFVSSYGRYPITKKWGQSPFKKNANGIEHRTSWTNEDHAIAEAMIEKLKNCTA